MEGFLRIVGAVLSTSLFSALLGFGLAAASKKLRVVRSPKLEKLLTALPGLNCGVCGYTGCEAYAEALAGEEDSDPGKCRPGGVEAVTTISRILGVELVKGTQRMVAHLACQGGDDIAVREFLYRGYSDCEAVRIHFQGDKGCKYGCLGLGTCVKCCPVDAIAHTDNGLVQVDASLCIGCEICAAVCPSGVMKMIPANAKWHVACNSQDKAKTTKSLCRAGCIGCRICERKFPDSGFIVADNLSRLDYDRITEEGLEAVADACPPKCIVRTKK